MFTFDYTISTEELTNSILEFFDITIQELEITIQISYSIYGTYRPATFYDPAEYPDLEVENIEVQEVFLDGDLVILNEYKKATVTSYIDELTGSKYWQDKIEGLCWEDTEHKKQLLEDF